ncbi:MAG: coproporphyrinogen III oxidase [Betaproteobacteria bacterium TMED82]|nr:MAG: coproporphyrinogen III oxidase [Betaproteobacteria bacterium TMED82]|tara:strand:+ start:22656 stop:23582 length:927 start_codon:yes stop_codon:yes gene_type:complete
MDISSSSKCFQNLQKEICQCISTEENLDFIEDSWSKSDDNSLHGYGFTKIIENGSIIERGGVNFSHVKGKQLPTSATKNRPELAGLAFNAVGLSLVLHPVNPFVPTVHMNIRYFSTVSDNTSEKIWWYGGGMDLTPYYLFEEDAIHFHVSCKEALDCFSLDYYPRFKKACDEYFFLKHRKETRGVGGIFFDDFSELGPQKSLDLVESVGSSFLGAYMPILNRRKDIPYGEKEKMFQAYRRGRYVEFNLVYDRGTLFGLQSGGRIESILMSMPPRASWIYDWKPEPKSPEDKLYKYLQPIDWVNWRKKS